MAQLTRKYESLEALLAFADQGRAAGRCYPRIHGDADFTGRTFADWNELRRAVHETWQEGLDELQWMLFELQRDKLPMPKSSRRRARFNEDAGDEVCIDRLRAGQPYWREASRESCHAPRHVCLIADVSTLAYVEWRDILWRGAVAIALADLLTRQGNRVELHAISAQTSAYKNGMGSLASVCLKESAAALDTESVLNAISGWFYRLCMFQERTSEPRARVADSMGHSRPVSIDEPEIAELIGRNAEGFLLTQLWDKETALARAREILAEMV